MKEQVVSIVFLAFLVLVPVGIVALLIVNAARGAAQRSGVAAAGREIGWQGPGNSEAEKAPLAGLLGPTLFAMQGKATNRLSGVLHGRVGTSDVYLAGYGFSGTSPIPSLQRSGTYRLITIVAGGPRQPFWLLSPRPDLLGSIAASLASGFLEQLADPAWSWARVSSSAAAQGLGLRSGDVAQLHDAVAPGGCLFFFKDAIVLLDIGDPDGAWVREAPGRAARVIKAVLR